MARWLEQETVRTPPDRYRIDILSQLGMQEDSCVVTLDKNNIAGSDTMIQTHARVPASLRRCVILRAAGIVASKAAALL